VFTVRLYHVSVAEDAEDAAAVQQKPLPAASPAAPPVGAVNDVVCVDDIPMNRKILLLYLKSIGITSVHDFGSGQEALEYLANNHTDVVLTDLWMPGMNGVEFAKKVRELAPSTPVMAITADTDSKLSFDTTVFAGILTKPVTAEMLQKALRPIDSGNEVQKG
jgi:CheY-like chemotaxis protein